MFIGAAGNSAEMPNPGVLTQFVGKSGGNRPSVSLYYDYENGDIQGRNLDPISIWCRASRPTGAPSARTATASPSYKNLNLGVGGPIITDRDVGPLRLPEPAELGGGAAGRRHSWTARRSTPSCSTTPARPPTR